MRSWNVLLHVIGSLVLAVSVTSAQTPTAPVVHEQPSATLQSYAWGAYCSLVNLLSTAAPTVASVHSDMDTGSVAQDHSHRVQPGTHVVITGTAFCGAAVALAEAYKNEEAWRTGGPLWDVSPIAPQKYPAAPTNQKPTTIEFVVPNVRVLQSGQELMYVIVLTKNSQTVLAPDPLAAYPVPTPQYISSVDPPAVALPSSMSINHQAQLVIHGTGFTGYPPVIGGVFGNGTIGSVTNPMFSTANVSANYAELLLPNSCDQEGLLMLLTQPSIGAYNSIGSSSPITVACMKDAPKNSFYSLVGETPLVNAGVTYGGMLKIPPGDQTIIVSGPYLRFIKEVWEAAPGPTTKLNFHYTRTNNQPSTVETMTIDVPNAQPNATFGICLKFIDGLQGISGVCYGQSTVQVNPS